MAWLLDTLAVADDILDTRNTALDSPGDQRTSGNESDLVDALERVRNLGPAWNASAIGCAYAALRAALDATGDVIQGTVERIEETVLPALASACVTFGDDAGLGAVTPPDHVGDDLTAIVEDAVDAFRERHEGAGGLIEAAQRALAGGEDGCRELALHAHDGYTHPLAYRLLHDIIAPKDDEMASTIPTESFSFDMDEGTNLKRTSLGRETVIVDRNHHGALVHYPPAFTESDSRNSVVGLDGRHFGDAVVEKWAALAGETVERSGHGSELEYGSETANTFLKHIREDQTFQAILRFGRDKEGAVVFAHTAALAKSLPVVGEGAVIRVFSKATKEVIRTAKTYRRQQFTVGDIAASVECSAWTVRRVLNELTELGYLEKRETKAGVANEFRALEEPDEGEVELPDLDGPFTPEEGPKEGASRELPSGDPDNSAIGVSSTGFVWVTGVDMRTEARFRRGRATLPAPEDTEMAAPPG